MRYILLFVLLPVFALPVQAQITEFPFYESFEDEDSPGFIYGNFYRQPYQFTPATLPQSGQYFIMTNMGGSATLYTDYLDFSGMTEDPVVSMYLRYGFGAFRERRGDVRFQYSVNGGESWASFFNEDSSSLGVNWSDGIWDCCRNDFTFHQISMKGMAGRDSVLLRYWAVLQDPDLGYPGIGFQMDDFRIRERSAVDVALLGFSVADDDPWNRADSTELRLTLRNDGTSGTDVPLEVVVETPDGVQQVKTYTIPALAATEQTIQSLWVDLRTPAAYRVTVRAAAPGDLYAFNDTLQLHTATRTAYAGLPVNEDFEDLRFFDTAYIHTASLAGAEGFYFATAPGKGLLEASPAARAFEGSLTPFIDGKSGYSLAMTVDASAYSVTTDKVYLSLQVKSPQMRTRDKKQILVRGNDSNPWLLLYDLRSLPVYNRFVSLGGLPVSEVLEAGGQEYSSRTQVLFTQSVERLYPFGGMYIDNIELIAPEVNVRALSLRSLADAFYPSGNDTVEVQLTNNAIDTVYAVPLDILVRGSNGTDTVRHTLAETLAPGDTITRRLAGIDLSTPGNYRLEVQVNVAGDEIRPDDLQTITVVSRSRVQAFPYTEGFENVPVTDYASSAELEGATGLYHEILDHEAFVAFTDDVIAAGEGSKAAHLTATGPFPYNTGEHGLVLTLDLEGQEAGVDGVGLSLLLHRYSQNVENWGGDIRLRGNPQEPWLELFRWIDLPDLPDWQQVSNLDLGRCLAAGGQEFSALTQVMIYHKGASLKVDRNGLSVDSITVVIPPDDLGITRLDFPGVYERDGTDTVSFTVRNAGESSLRLDSVFLIVEGSRPQEERVHADTLLAPGDSLVYAFEMDLAARDSVYMSARISAPGDGYAGNDVWSVVTLHKTRVPGLPYFEDFENVARITYDEAANPTQLDGYFFEQIVMPWEKHGILRFYLESRPPYAGEQAVYLGGESGVELLTLTANLSEYRADTDSVFLSFVLRNYSSERSGFDSLYLRGAEGGEYFPIFGWYRKGWREHEQYIFPLSQLLAERGQDFSATTQLLFSHRYIMIAVDNVALSAYRHEMSPTDMNFVRLSNTLQNVRVRVTNGGASNIEAGEKVYLDTEGPRGTQRQEVALEAALFPGQSRYLVFSDNEIGQTGDYTYRAYTALPGDALPGNDTLIQTLPLVLGLNPAATTDLEVYPVPARDYLQVKQTVAPGTVVQVSVRDMQGREVYSRQVLPRDSQMDVQVPVQHLKPGLYTLLVISDGVLSTRLWARE